MDNLFLFESKRKAGLLEGKVETRQTETTPAESCSKCKEIVLPGARNRAITAPHGSPLHEAGPTHDHRRRAGVVRHQLPSNPRVWSCGSDSNLMQEHPEGKRATDTGGFQGPFSIEFINLLKESNF
ncbi:hypothetical protein FNV43_RR02229 [Rhamnella rubrinervis]|uniref:Uncharacterized protein n=1 Tax=Rhamnella rubrinervis TaxID=2594499 RepID=A0A8K0HRZ6_9ROSA|nr:hypothetical protein FNV43_RR02229 [Rhamnella rubrinervis]